MLSSDDTIYAQATGAGRAGIAIVRISGRRAGDLVRGLAGALPPPRRASLRRLVDPRTGELVDRGLVLWLPGPESFTGEDQVEFHVHGGQAVKAALLGCLGTFEGCRPAEAGEFTRRAYVNRRMDLSSVEGLADLVDAQTQAQRRQALRQAEGGLGRRADEWRNQLIEISALLEAVLDFSDEADVTGEVIGQARRAILNVIGDFERQLSMGRRAERLRDGFRVVIAGPPNAGKSTLLNALARREVAIVSPVPGTTRDAIEVHCDIGGLPVDFIDTAGLRDIPEEVEREGIRRARLRIEEADLVLWLVPPDDSTTFPPPADFILSVATKADLGAAERPTDLSLSAATGDGIAALLDRIEKEAEAALIGEGDALLTRERHRIAVSQARDAVTRALVALDGANEELAAEDVRLATRAVERISGRVDVEDVLDRIFSQFCIGK